MVHTVQKERVCPPPASVSALCRAGAAGTAREKRPASQAEDAGSSTVDFSAPGCQIDKNFFGAVRFLLTATAPGSSFFQGIVVSWESTVEIYSPSLALSSSCCCELFQLAVHRKGRADAA